MFPIRERHAKRPLGRRFFFAVCTTIIISFTSLIILAALTQRAHFRQLIAYNTLESASIMAYSLSDTVKSNPKNNLQTRYPNLIDNAHSNIVSLMIVNTKKEILAQFHSSTLPTYDLTHTINSDHLQALYEGKTITENGHDYFIAITPIVYGQDSEKLGYLAIASSLEHIDNIILHTTYQLIVILVGVIIIILTLLQV